MNTVNNFSKNMTEATNSANSAAKTASDAAASATAGAKACEGIVDGLNTMVDTVTKKTCVLSIEDGILTIRLEHDLQESNTDFKRRVENQK